jgi:hypothetical protein
MEPCFRSLETAGTASSFGCAEESQKIRWLPDYEGAEEPDGPHRRAEPKTACRPLYQGNPEKMEATACNDIPPEISRLIVSLGSRSCGLYAFRSSLRALSTLQATPLPSAVVSKHPLQEMHFDFSRSPPFQRLIRWGSRIRGRHSAT